MSDPRQAFPAIRPRCCFRYFTFFGINMTIVPCRYQLPASGFQLDLPTTGGKPDAGGGKLSPRATRGSPRRPVVLFAADPRRQALALVEPHLDADAAVGRERLREAVVDV